MWDARRHARLGTFHAGGEELEVQGSFKDGGRTLTMLLAASGQQRVADSLTGAEIFARLSVPVAHTAEGVTRDGSPVMLSRDGVPVAEAVDGGRIL